MIRATTPTLTLTIKDDSVDLTQAKAVYVTLEQGQSFSVTKTGSDLSVTEKTVECWLSQEETLSLKVGTKLEIQVNWTYTDTDGTTKRNATVIKAIDVTRQLLDEVIA